MVTISKNAKKYPAPTIQSRLRLYGQTGMRSSLAKALGGEVSISDPTSLC